MTERRAKTQETVICCRPWMLLDPTERNLFRWQALHQFAHSRTTFSVPTLAERASTTPERADEMIKDAERMRWIWTPQDGIWVGRLAHRR